MMNKRIFSSILLAGRGIAADTTPPNLCKRQRQVALKSDRLPTVLNALFEVSLTN